MLSVAGGQGGTGIGASVGGNGGAGLVRLEYQSVPLDPLVEAPKIAPFSASNPDSDDILSIGILAAQRDRPESLSVAVSCWLIPTGSFGALTFSADDLSDPLNPVFGWNMTLRVDNQPGAGTNLIDVPFRGPNSIMMNSFEQELGNMLNVGLPDGMGSPVAVRFQGARVNDQTADPCDIDLIGLDADIVEDSLTPWVNHPAELNQFTPLPNMIRYTIIFDRDLSPTLLDLVRGVSNITIQVQPE